MMAEYSSLDAVPVAQAGSQEVLMARRERGIAAYSSGSASSTGSAPSGTIVSTDRLSQTVTCWPSSGEPSESRRVYVPASRTQTVWNSCQGAKSTQPIGSPF